ncbi:MAG: PAS domain S-box protein [Clostridia bacterium]|nr:PAS domain S-box protein [Clostridia bacterium]
MKKKLTIRKAIFYPFMITITLAIALFILSWRIEYNQLANDQGQKILEITNNTIKEKLGNLLSEPVMVLNTYSHNILYQDYLNQEDYSSLESFILMFFKSIHQDIPQISVVFYAGEDQSFIGLRANSNQEDYSLMLQGIRTDFSLNIYDTEEISDALAYSFPAGTYDPTVRPFYAPVKENPTFQWTEIYINQDEIKEATITAVVPIITRAGDFVGVAGMDVKLNGIELFLREESKKSGGLLYIVDNKGELVASSDDSQIFMENDSERRMLARKSENPLIVNSIKSYEDSKAGEYYTFELDHQKYFFLNETLLEPDGLNWHVVSVLSEEQLMGGIKNRQYVIIGLIIVVTTIGAVIALLLIAYFTKPIRMSAEMAVEISKGNWESENDLHRTSIHETNELLEALMMMKNSLRESFYSIKKNEAQYRELVENLDEMIYSISMKRRFNSVNKPFENYFGIHRDEIIGVEVKPFFKKNVLTDEWFEHYMHVLEEKKPERFQLNLVKNDKRQVLNFSLVPVLNEENDIEVVLGSISNITELVVVLEKLSEMTTKENERLEELVKQRTEDLEATMKELANQEKLASLGSLVSGVAHEINTPLGVAVTTASYIKKINEENLKQMDEGKMSKSNFIKFIHNLNDSIEILNSNLYRASELIKSFKMIAVNQSHETIERFNVYQYFNATVLSLKHELKQGGHHVELLMDEALFIVSYPGAYSHILTNLIMNAIIHGFKDLEDKRIEIRAHKEDKNFVIDFSDNGIGMPEAQVHKIFEPFFTSKRGQGGTGLGLSVVYNLITGMNGTIKCESRPDQGTRFIIKIPLEE